MAQNTETIEPNTAARADQAVAPPQVDKQLDPLPSSDRDLHRKSFNVHNPRVRMAAIIGVILLVVALFFLWRYFSSYESTDDAQVDGHLNSVSSRVSGHVEKLLVQDNQYVDAGTPLVVIDPRDFQVAVDRAQADYDSALAAARAAQVNVPITSVNSGSQISTAQADVENARAGISAARQQRAGAIAQVAQAQANNVKAQSDVARYKLLVDKQEISQQQYEQAIAAAQSSAASVDAARDAASAAQDQIRQAEARLAQAESNARAAATGPQQIAVIRARAQAAEADAEQKKAALEQAKLNLSYTNIVAPVSGIVTNRTVEVGQNVQLGQDLMKVINLDDIWVTANFKENQLHKMVVGQAVTIHADINDKDYKGHLQSLSGASGAITSLLPPENATGNYVKVVQRIPVKITFDPGETKDHVLRPGMSVEPKVWIR
ncbi:MAG: HlyD family secretion protein [Terriglobales bacterium]